MSSVASPFIEEVTAHAQSGSLEDAQEICADGTYFPNNLRNIMCLYVLCKNIQNSAFVGALVPTELVIQFTMHGMNNMKHKIQVVLTVYISFIGFS